VSYSLVNVYNLALSACGADTSISSPTERSREADLCQTWYPFIRDLAASGAPWPSVRAYARLALLTERDRADPWLSSDPAPTWKYGYSKPENLLHPYHLATFDRFDFLQGQIMTDNKEPILHYNRREEDPSKWDHGYFTAVVHLLAARIARPLTGTARVVQENFEIAETQRMSVLSAFVNGVDTQVDALPDWLQARGTDIATPVKFIYPFQTFFLESV